MLVNLITDGQSNGTFASAMDAIIAGLDGALERYSEKLPKIYNSCDNFAEFLFSINDIVAALTGWLIVTDDSGEEVDGDIEVIILNETQSQGFQPQAQDYDYIDDLGLNLNDVMQLFSKNQSRSFVVIDHWAEILTPQEMENKVRYEWESTGGDKSLCTFEKTGNGNKQKVTGKDKIGIVTYTVTRMYKFGGIRWGTTSGKPATAKVVTIKQLVPNSSVVVKSNTTAYRMPTDYYTASNINKSKSLSTGALLTVKGEHKATSGSRSDWYYVQTSDNWWGFVPKGAVAKKLSDGTVYAKAAVSSNNIEPNEKEANARYIYDYLIARGWTIQAIAGVLGNMQRECQMNPGAWERLNDTTGGYGLIQSTPSSDKFLKWKDLTVTAANNMADSNDQQQLKQLMDWQLEHLIWSMKTMKDGDREWYPSLASPYYDSLPSSLRNMTCDQFIASTINSGDLARVFNAIYLRSQDYSDAAVKKNRVDPANEWYRKLDAWSKLP